MSFNVKNKTFLTKKKKTHKMIKNYDHHYLDSNSKTYFTKKLDFEMIEIKAKKEKP